MRRADFVALPVHGERRPPRLHDAVHADVSNAAQRIARDHHGQRDVRAAVLRPALHERQRVEIHRVISLDDLLTGRIAAPHARWKLSDLEQARQKRELGDDPLGDLHLEQLSDARANLVQPLDAERHAHTPHRTEEVDRDGNRGALAVHQHGLLEQQRFAAPRLLHHAVGDLAQLEIERHRVPHAHQLAGAVELLDELSEAVDGHGRE